LEPLELSDAVERLEQAALTTERSKAIERLERLELGSVFVAWHRFSLEIAFPVKSKR
jgi:hypothetical protein